MNIQELPGGDVFDIDSLALPKIDDLALAQALVKAGWVSSLDEIYGGESTPEQKKRLEEARVRWARYQELNPPTDDFDFDDLDVPTKGS